MALLAFTLSVLALVVTQSHAQTGLQCFTGGANADCRPFIADFCSRISGVTLPAGDYVRHCYNAGSVKCDLWALNRDTTQAQTLSAVDCAQGLADVQACSGLKAGGFIFAGGLFYVMDPNGANLNGCTAAISGSN